MKGKVVVITGASSGIGRALALKCVSEGAKVVAAARRLERLNELAILCDSKNILVVKADVSVEADCKELIDSAVAHFGTIDILINNAGISMRALFQNCEIDVLRRVMDVNFWGTVYCTKYALPHLIANKGSVVGVISVAGYIGLPARTAYSASKFAVRGFLETLRLENKKHGLHVLISAPGFVASEIRMHALVENGSEQSESPRAENKLMTAEKCANLIYRAIIKRKRSQILSWVEGRVAVFLSKWCPRLVDYFNYRQMEREPNSPLKT